MDGWRFSYWYFPTFPPKRLSSLLIISQLVNQATEVVVPYVVDRFVNASNGTESEDDPEEDKFRKQSTLPPYPVSARLVQKLICSWSGIFRRFNVHVSSDVLFFDLSQGLFAEYIELLVQFGYLSLFSCVYPLTAVLLLINNLTEIRSDAYKICQLFRKPFSTPVANMGVWQVSKTMRSKPGAEGCVLQGNNWTLSPCCRLPSRS